MLMHTRMMSCKEDTLEWLGCEREDIDAIGSELLPMPPSIGAESGDRGRDGGVTEGRGGAIPLLEDIFDPEIIKTPQIK